MNALEANKLSKRSKQKRQFNFDLLYGSIETAIKAAAISNLLHVIINISSIKYSYDELIFTINILQFEGFIISCDSDNITIGWGYLI